MRFLQLSLACTAVLLLLVTASCGPPEEGGRTATASTAAPPDTELAGTAELPANFPRDIPMPPELEISEARFSEGDAWTQPNFFVRGSSPLSVAELAAFYNERLPASGYEVHQRADPGAASTLVYFEGTALRDCSVQLSAAGDGTNVVISLPLRD